MSLRVKYGITCLQSIEDFLSCLDSATEACDIMVKKGDKKRER